MKLEEQPQQQRWFRALAWSSSPDPSMKAGAQEHLRGQPQAAPGPWYMAREEATCCSQAVSRSSARPPFPLAQGAAPSKRARRQSPRYSCHADCSWGGEGGKPPLQCRHPAPSQRDHLTPGSREEHVSTDFQTPNGIIHQYFTLIRNFLLDFNSQLL